MVQAHKLADRKDDLYETPEVAVRALLKHEQLPRCLWEPACGPGAIVKVLRDAGYQVIASDLVDYQCPQSSCGIDFLMETAAPDDVEGIVTNPPFKLASQFVEKGLALVPTVIMLLRLNFIESAKRAPILDTGHLAKVFPFSERLPMMHRHGWDGPVATSQTPYAWFKFERNHTGPTTLQRISWRN